MRFAVIVLACLSGMPLGAKDKIDCWSGSKGITEKNLSGFVLRLSPIANLEDSVTGDGCRAQLINPRGKLIFSAGDWSFDIVVTGLDVNGDGIPDLVLEGYSGGAHCCWSYYVISLGPVPGLLIQFENERGAGFKVNPGTGRVEIEALDGAFDYFDESPHAGSPFPQVYLRLEHKHLVDISREHMLDYDKEISKLKSGISAKDLNVFLQAENKSEMMGWENVSEPALEIVLAYLYSGREAQARDTLRKMWPDFDQERIWKLILETRRKGILRYTKSTG